AFVADTVAVSERCERGDEPERYGDRPRQRETEAGMGRPAREDDHRGECRGGSEDRVLERAETEDAYARLARLEACSLERVTVDDETSTDHEDPETGRHDRAGTPDPQTRTDRKSTRLNSSH